MADVDVGEGEQFADAVSFGAGGHAADCPSAGLFGVEAGAGLAAGVERLAVGLSIGEAVDGGMGAGRGGSGELQPDPALAESPLLDGEQGIAAEKLPFRKVDPALQSDLERGLFAVDVGAGQGEGFFDAQALHGGGAVGQQAELLAAAFQGFPEQGGLFGGDIELIAQLAGVARAGDQQFGVADLVGGEAEELEGQQRSGLGDGAGQKIA